MVKRINDLLHRPNSLKGATGILAVTLLLSNVLGLVRNVILAVNFSPEDLDIYYAGFQIPNLIFNLLVFGAISTAFIPIFSELISQKKNRESWQVAQTIFNLVTIVLIGLSAILACLMPTIIHLVVPGFDELRMSQATVISRIMFLQAIIFGWSYVLGGILNTYKKFIAYALAPILYNLSIIVGAFFGKEIGIIGLAWSVVVGAACHFLIQLVPAWKIGFRFGLSLKLNNPSIKHIARLMIPRNLSLGAQQLNFVIFTAIASTMTVGSIAVFNLTNDFQTTPTVIFANSLAVALFPTLSELASQKDWLEFERVLAKSLRITLFFLIPSAFLMFILRAQIMRLYVGLGKNFDWDETRMAINTLAYFALGIVPSGIVAIFSRAFYARKNTKLPMYLGAISIVCGILIAFFSKTVGVGGLALALSLAACINAALLVYAYQINYRRKLVERKIIYTGFISLFSSLGMAAICWWTLRLVDALYHQKNIPTSTEEVIGLAIQALIAFLAAGIVYWLLAKIFLKEELGMLHKKND